ncbi:MAG: HD domain-containing protein, partial [bacterium]|nr:HD domain-containing protein [bacterium]
MLHDIRSLAENNIEGYNHKLAIALCQIHDDPEIITTDIPTQIKEAMSQTELISLRDQELRAIISIAKQLIPQKARR